MAFYFPELFCEKNQPLIVKKDIIYDNGIIIYKGENCYVKDIVEYGFDVVTENGVELRFLNSQMSDFFEKTTLNTTSNFIKNTVSKLLNDLGVNYSPLQSKLQREQNILTFKSDMEIRGAGVIIKSGEKFYYEEYKGLYSLYDILTFRKALSMSDREVAQFCQLQTAPAETELV